MQLSHLLIQMLNLTCICERLVCLPLSQTDHFCLESQTCTPLETCLYLKHTKLKKYIESCKLMVKCTVYTKYFAFTPPYKYSPNGLPCLLYCSFWHVFVVISAVSERCVILQYVSIIKQQSVCEWHGRWKDLRHNGWSVWKQTWLHSSEV